MVRLRQCDLHALLEFLRDVYRPHNLEEFRRYVVAAVPALVRSEITSYNEVNVRAGHDTWSAEPAEAISAQSRVAFDAHLHEHPLIRHYFKTHDGRALKISDFLSRRQFHALGLYKEFYCDLRIEHQMAVTLPAHAPVVIGIALNRGSPDYSERDRLCLNLLRPHLIQAYRNAVALTASEHALALVAQGVEETGRGLILLDARWQVRLMTAGARRSLERIFGPCCCRNRRLPPDLERWVREQAKPFAGPDVPAARKPLLIGRGADCLRVRLIAKSNQTLLLLHDEAREQTPPRFESLGLSRREAEVLGWVSMGKTNLEIATILDLNVRTVEKHLEHILEKLGVETRTAAAVMAGQFAAGE